MFAHDYIPALKFGAKILSSEVLGGLETFSKSWYVDGDNGNDSNTGESPATSFKTIQTAVTAASADDVIYVRAKNMVAGATDPASYTENVLIPAGKSRLKIIGISADRTQGGLPQLKVGTVTSSPIITVQSPGVTITNLGINGAGGTGGGIKFDDNGTTKTAFGGTVLNCHLKNCVPSTATSSTTGAAIHLAGAPWQMLIKGNVFYKNVGGITVSPTYSDPQDIVIEDNVFAGTAATVDSYINIISAADGIVIRRNVFASVLPALSSGAVARYVDLTGCTGIFTENYVSGVYTTTGFGAAKVAAKIPTTVGMPHNYSDSGLIVREA